MLEYQKDAEKRLLTPVFDPSDPDSEVVLQRHEDGPYTNVERLVVHHSPAGFEWGYGGSGPSDLALNIMAAFFPIESPEDAVRAFKGECSRTAYGLYQEFKERFLKNAPEVQARIPTWLIRQWLEQPEQQEIIRQQRKL